MRSVAHAACSTRPFAPRPTRCAVCRVGYSLPFITPPRPTDCRYAPSRGIRQPAGKFVLAYPWGAPRLRAAALSSLPACAPFPQRRAIYRAFPCTRRPPSAECANARRTMSAGDFRGFLFGRPAARAHSAASLLRRSPSRIIPPGFVLPAVALAPPRFPLRSRRAPVLSSVGHRGCAASRGNTLTRQQKKKSVRLERPGTDHLGRIVVRYAFTICE